MPENRLINHQNWSHSSEKYFGDKPGARKKDDIFPKGDRPDNSLFLLDEVMLYLG